jgi:hypothetical protein
MENIIHVIICGNHSNKNLIEILNNEHNYGIYKYHDINTTNTDIKSLITKFDNMTQLILSTDKTELDIYPDYDVVYIVINDNYNDNDSKYYFTKKYTELCGYYGISHIIINKNENENNIINEIIYSLKNHNELELYALKDISLKILEDNDIKNHLFINNEELEEYFCKFCENTLSLKTLDNNEKKKLCSQHLINNGEIKLGDNGLVTVRNVYEDNYHIQKIYFSQSNPKFRLLCETKDKKIYLPLTGNRYLQNKCFIVLKNTLIDNIINLELILEIINRNKMYHIYDSVNQNGIVLSEYINSNYSKTKIFIKNKYEQIENIYSIKNSENLIEPFIEFQLENKPICKEIASYEIDVKNVKETSLKLFMSLMYYLRQSIDNNDLINYFSNTFTFNFYLDITGMKFISDIKNTLTPDIMTQLNTFLFSYFTKNKYINTEILQSNTFAYISQIENTKFIKYGNIYNKWLFNNKTKRNILSRISISKGFPRFPLGSKYYNTLDIQNTLKLLNICGDIIVHDLDRDLTQFESNEELIQKYGSQYNYYVVGGIDNINIVNNMISKGVKYVVVEEDGILGSIDNDSDNDNDSDSEELFNFINKIPLDNLIIDITIDENINNINKLMNILNILTIKKIQIIRLSIEYINIDIKEFILKLVPSFTYFKKIIINSHYIKTINDLRFLWSINKVVPELENVIWKRIIPIEDLVIEMINFDKDGTIPICVQDTSGSVKGIIKANNETLKKIINEMKVYEYNQITKKPEFVQYENKNHEILSFCRSKNNTSFILTIGNETLFLTNSNFEIKNCLNNSSNLIIDEINNKINENNEYLEKLKKNTGNFPMKIWEKYWDILHNNNNNNKHDNVNEHDNTNKINMSADIIFNLLSFFNGNSIKWHDVINELNKIKHSSELYNKSFVGINNIKRDYILIGINIEKDKTDIYLNEHLGIELIRNMNDCQNFYFDYKIINQEKFNIYFNSNIKLKFISLYSKDMPYYIGNGLIDKCITFNTIMNMYPKVAIEQHKIISYELRLCLLKRKDDIIKIRDWGKDYKPLIISEYKNTICKYLQNELYIENNRYNIIKSIGNSENFIISDTNVLLSDCIINSENNLDIEKLKTNNLVIWKTVLKSGQITFGLYGRQE